jgi:DNA polymerase
VILIDFETRSQLDVKNVSAYKYSIHPSTQVMCLGIRDDFEKTVFPLHTMQTHWRDLDSTTQEKISILCRNYIQTPVGPRIVWAHNAFFERCIWENVLVKRLGWPRIDPQGYRCSSALAASLSLPRKLEMLAEALHLPVKKDMAGHRVMLKLTKPKRYSKKVLEFMQSIDMDNEPIFWEPDEVPEDFDKLYKYCLTDIDTEWEVIKRLKKYQLSPQELEYWHLDQTVNERGIYVDVPTIEKILKLVDEYKAKKNLRLKELTGLESAAQRDELLFAIRSRGLFLKDLTAKTISDTLLATDLDPVVRELLEIRQTVSKSSTAKFNAFIDRVCPDSRIRDILVYHAASTGRWGGAGIQVQNLTRPTIDDVDFAIETFKDSDLATVELLWSDPMAAFSSAIRGMIMPAPGNKFYVADYSAIEARVVMWMAGDKHACEAFENGGDLYVELASEVYNRKITKADKDERQLGKAGILGCGFGMGAGKFVSSCDVQWNLKISDEIAQKVVKSYRKKYPRVPKMWNNLEEAAIKATQTPGKKYTVNKTSWFVDGEFLFCILPSGRRIAYYGPQIKETTTPWGEKKPALWHWGVDGLTKKWIFFSTWGGTLTENVVQASARCLLAAAAYRCEKAGYQVAFHAHDELICETPKEFGYLKDFEKLMNERPAWAADLPIASEAEIMDRYKK